MKNIDRMLGCGDPSFGGAMYGCLHCGNFKFVSFRCHSRFFLPVATNMLSNAPAVWLSNLSMSITAIAFLPLMKTSVTFSPGSFSPELSLPFGLQCHFTKVFQPEPFQKFHPRLYHGPSYFWLQSQIESPYSLSPFRMRLQ